jgi:hypothetical protein
MIRTDYQLVQISQEATNMMDSNDIEYFLINHLNIHL